MGVVRNEKLTTNPGADFCFETDDLVAIIGTENAYGAFQAMAAPEAEVAASAAGPTASVDPTT